MVGDRGIEMGRLRWRCMRRGLLELDLVLDRFLRTHFESLDDAQLRTLDALLDLDDTELWELVSGRKACGEPEFDRLITLLRAH